MVAAAIEPVGDALAARTIWTIRNSPNGTLPGAEIRSMSCVSAT